MKQLPLRIFAQATGTGQLQQGARRPAASRIDGVPRLAGRRRSRRRYVNRAARLMRNVAHRVSDPCSVPKVFGWLGGAGTVPGGPVTAPASTALQSGSLLAPPFFIGGALAGAAGAGNEHERRLRLLSWLSSGGEIGRGHQGLFCAPAGLCAARSLSKRLDAGLAGSCLPCACFNCVRNVL